MSSAAEAELGALFINAKTAISIRQTLIEPGHPQPRTPMQTDNAMAHALLTNKILPKALKAMDGRFHWLRCRNAQGQFRYYWRPGTQNLGVYFTSITPQHTTSLYAQQSSRQSMIQNTGNSSRTQETPQNWGAQKITRKTKLPKISQKLPSWRGQ